MASELRGLAEWDRLIESFAAKGASLDPISDAIHESFLADMDSGWTFNEDTGRLKDSLTDASSNDHIWAAKDQSLTMGSRDPASVTHITGFEAPDLDSQAAAEIFRDWVFHGER